MWFHFGDWSSETGTFGFMLPSFVSVDTRMVQHEEIHESEMHQLPIPIHRVSPPHEVQFDLFKLSYN